MTTWLEDASANRHIKTYVKDFLDVSGNFTVRNNEDYKWNSYGQLMSGVYESDIKYIICNGDEGDPGAFMDRMLLESYPYRIIEGMIAAGYAVGASEGILSGKEALSAPMGQAGSTALGICGGLPVRLGLIASLRDTRGLAFPGQVRRRGETVLLWCGTPSATRAVLRPEKVL